MRHFPYDGKLAKISTTTREFAVTHHDSVYETTFFVFREIALTGPNTFSNKFLSDLDIWLCDGYYVSVRYISFKRPDRNAALFAGAVFCNPLPHQRDNSFTCETDLILAGQQQFDNVTKLDLLSILEKATGGELAASSKIFQLDGAHDFEYASELVNRDIWFSALNLTIIGAQLGPQDAFCRALISSQLRRSEPAFDGFEDLCNWLVFPDAAREGFRPQIKLVINPPIDLITESTKLSNNQLSVAVHAHVNLSLDNFSLAVRSFPGEGLQPQSQVKSQLNWAIESTGVRSGTANIAVKNANSVLAMLSLGDSTIRRQWFLDPDKAANNRLVAMQQFDRDLKMVKQSVLDATDQSKFELGIAALLFIMGFSPAVQLETNAPDLILTTPVGRLVIVECTLRIADFSAKIGKLVDRQNSLEKAMQSSGHGTPILSVLICAAPRAQIAATQEELKRHKVILLARESIEEAIRRLPGRQEPDSLFDEAIATFATNVAE